MTLDTHVAPDVCPTRSPRPWARRLRAAGLGLGLLMTAGMGCDTPAPEAGEAQISVMTRTLGAADQVARIELTVQDIDPDDGVDMPDAVHELVRVGGRWQGDIARIEPGQRRFIARAYDADGNLRFEGQIDGRIQARRRLPIALILQQIERRDPFANHAPRIRGVVGVPQAIGGGDVTHMRVVADDPDGDPITYAWRLGNGEPVDVDGEPVELGDDAHRLYWQAPIENGLESLSITVTDDKDAATTYAFEVLVDDGLGIGGQANVQATVNGWPVVDRVTIGAPGYLEVGAAIELAVEASDIDEDPLTYAWSAPDCDGAFDDATAANPLFTLAAAPAAGTCTLQVDVDDGRGGSATGSLVVEVAPEVDIVFNPVIETTFQSHLEADAGTIVNLRAEATDPNGEALTFGWMVSTGAVLAELPDLPEGVSHADYRMGDEGVRITVTATNESGASSQHTFIIGVPGGGDDPVCGANLLRNGGFEDVPGGQTGQNLMPSEWVAVRSSPDTYSNDGSYGLPPEGFGHFPGVVAAEGIRWIAGSAGIGEHPGQALSAALEPGVEYRVSVRMHQARDYANAPAKVRIALADSGDAAPTTSVEVGGLRVENGATEWGADAFTFVAPANAAALGWFVIRPDASEGNTYPGIDALVLSRCD